MAAAAIPAHHEGTAGDGIAYGVDVGGTKIEFVAFDRDLAPIERTRIATPGADYPRFLAAIASLVGEADRRHGGHPPIGIGLPGLTDAEGRAFCANLPGVSGQPVARDLAAIVGRAVATQNDTRCFALSEATGGAGAGHRSVFGAILGTGAAGGFVVDGRLLRGRHGLAGEYGHLPLPAALAERYRLPIRTCGCGLPGCLEAYVAGAGLVALADHFGARINGGAALATACAAGDTAALATMDAFVDLLGAAFANIVKLLDPDIIVLGGGLSLVAGLAGRLPTAIAAHLFGGFAAPPVVTARFGDASGVRGAALLTRMVAP